MRLTRLLLSLVCAVGFGACTAPQRSVPTLASATVVSDFGTYDFQRIGVLPTTGLELQVGLAQIVQSAVGSELQGVSPIECVALGSAQLSGIDGFEPHLRGGYPAESVLTLAKRHRLDGLLVITVTDHQAFAPQRLGLQAELLSAETGMSLWQADVQLDAADGRTRGAAEAWSQGRGGDLSEDHWELILLSPRRFAQLAAFQLAKVFRA